MLLDESDSTLVYNFQSHRQRVSITIYPPQTPTEIGKISRVTQEEPCQNKSGEERNKPKKEGGKGKGAISRFVGRAGRQFT